jgi:hypothetical protein
MLDLDAKRAEAQNKQHPVRLGGEEFNLPPKIPLESLELIAEAKFRKAFAILFGEDPDAEPAGGKVTARFFSHRPETGDLEAIMGLYGQPGESSASPVSSLNNGRPPSKTGKRTTTGT